jgi:RimJ/RimL family protein N-acetyltransferase
MQERTTINPAIVNQTAWPALHESLRALRLSGELTQARDLIRSQPGFAASPGLRRLLHEHEDFWWAPIPGRRVTLERRGAQDADFVRACWSDAEFMRKFNRTARPLPAQDGALRQILAREHAGLLSEARALHWTIHSPAGPIGFVSATDYAAGHRRCEFLIGLPGHPASAAPVEAAHLAVTFLHERAGIERLTAYFYPENDYAARVARKFGFEHEGLLKGYIRNADGSRADLLVAGMVLIEGGPKRAQTVRKRVLSSI